MNNLLLRRRMMMAGGSPTPSPLPAGYTQKIIGVVSGTKAIDTGITAYYSDIVRVETNLLWHNVGTSLRQLCGNELQPWWGCDKGKFNYSGSLTPSTPAKNTVLTVDTWYYIDVAMPTSGSFEPLTLFTLNNNNIKKSNYQCFMDMKDLCNIYINDVLVFGGIPCSNPSNVDGLYDTVNQEFHPLISY